LEGHTFGLELPTERTTRQVVAVDAPVVRSGVNLSVGDCRRCAHAALGLGAPLCLARHRVDRVDATVSRADDDHSVDVRGRGEKMITALVSPWQREIGTSC